MFQISPASHLPQLDENPGDQLVAIGSAHASHLPPEERVCTDIFPTPVAIRRKSASDRLDRRPGRCLLGVHPFQLRSPYGFTPAEGKKPFEMWHKQTLQSKAFIIFRVSQSSGFQDHKHDDGFCTHLPGLRRPWPCHLGNRLQAYPMRRQHHRRYDHAGHCANLCNEGTNSVLI